MPTQQSYQNNQYIKNANSKNLFKQGKNMVLAKDINQEKKDRIKSWVTFYRNNLSYFVTHYMGVPLYPYQKFWLTLLGKSTNFLGVAARSSAKSLIIAMYSIARCILYPGTIVSLNSSTKAQAGLILSQHCQNLYNEHLNIQRETENLLTNNNNWSMTFLNGSKIEVVISGEGGRGHRSHVSVLEERRLIPTLIIDSIIRPFLVSRQPPFSRKPEYADYPKEEPCEIIITSSYYKSHDWWPEAKKLLKMILNGDTDVKAIILDYLIILKHGIKTKKQLQKEKAKMDSLSFLMEYGNIPYSSSSSAFYKIGMFNRSLKTVWRPIKDDFQTGKRNPYDISRKPGEKRCVGVDVSFRKGSQNDNSIITCARLFPTSKGWATEICYMESIDTKNVFLQALRIKQIYSEFTDFADEDALILDVAGGGVLVYDALTSVTKDDTRWDAKRNAMGTEYIAMKVMRHPSIDDKVYQELSERSLSTNAKECIYPISASQSLNSQIAFSFRDRLKKKLLKFLVDDTEEEEYLIKTRNKDILDQTDDGMKAFLLNANVQTTLMINECISLEVIPIGSSSGVKMQEPNGGRKDRFSSCSYLNWYVGLLDNELLKEDSGDSWESIMGVTIIM
jgi:hypothetical protein